MSLTPDATKGRTRRSRANPDSEGSSMRDRWLVSYADLVTLLFALFVVLYAAADHERARAVAVALSSQFSDQVETAGDAGAQGVLPGGDSLAAERAAIERTLDGNSALKTRARVASGERGVVVSLSEAGFFAPGEAAMSDDARTLLDALADDLRASSANLRVEGHTDATPISNARYPSNWELSAARASAVLAQLASRGVAASRLSVAGYAGERPVADNSTQEGRALNRRVDLVILRMPSE